MLNVVTTVVAVGGRFEEYDALMCRNCVLVDANGECGELHPDDPEPLNRLSGEYVIDAPTEPEHRLGECVGCGRYMHGDFQVVTVSTRIGS